MKQPTWAKSPMRRLIAACPDCDEFVDVPLRVHFTTRNGFLSTEVRAEPVKHCCDDGKERE